MVNKSIKFNFLDSPVGDMIAGSTEKGLCFLEWTDRGGIEKILERVTKRYGCCPEEGMNEHIKQLDYELSQYFNNSLTQFTTPMDVDGTSFENKVWAELLKISYGAIISYGKIAKTLNLKNGARAVGRANGANYLSIIIPCHRVIEANGNLRGYGGKLWRKEFLLKLEGAVGFRELKDKSQHELQL